MCKSISKDEKIKQSMETFSIFNILYTPYNNGLHWKIHIEDCSIDFYPTTHSWYDPVLKKRGKGIESFLIYIGKIEPK